jgi:sugar lactone lactonase YvrE
MVTFQDGVTVLGVATLATSGGNTTATLTTTALPLGSRSVTAVYGGDSSFQSSTSRTMSTVAGDGIGGTYLNSLFDVAVGANGHLFVGQYKPGLALVELATDGSFLATVGLETSDFVDAVTFDPQGRLYAKEPDAGVVSKIPFGPSGGIGDSQPYPIAQTAYIGGMAVDGAGTLFLADSNGAAVEIVPPHADGSPVQVQGDSSVIHIYGFNIPAAVALDKSGDILVADAGNNIVYRIAKETDGSFSAAFSPLVGTGITGYSGDGGPANAAELNAPSGLAVDAQGNLYIADAGNQVIREVQVGADNIPDGIITTLVGNGTAGYSGDGGPATSAALNLANGNVNGFQAGLAVDASGNLFIADGGNNVIRRAGGLIVAVQPVTSSSVSAALSSSQQGAVTLEATSNTDVGNAVSAVNGVTNSNPSVPETVTLDLGGGTYTTDTHVNTQPGVTLVIQNGTLVGGSPALVVNSGNVILRNVTAQNATNAPTIVVDGGSLTVRNCMIQESTGYAQAAMLVTGGSVDLGTSSSPGGSTFNVNGAGTLIQNATGNPIPAVGDLFENNGVAAPSIVVLNPTARGALTLAGNSNIAVPGVVIVDSSSTAALSASGNAVVSSPLATGVAVPDPLAALSGPSTAGLMNYGSVNLSKGSQTICPGIYSQIKVSGNASLTLNAGTYIIEGGGLTVTGNASINGSGVMIYNGGSSYPGGGGTFGGITLSGNGSFNLSAQTSGTYAGVLVFQSLQNTRALSFSGNAMAGTTGTIYAASALLSMSGNAQLTNPLIVGSLNLSGNVALTQTAAGSDGTGDTPGIANTLMAGDLNVYINDPGGLFTSDELARIQDAVNTWDALLAPYSVTISIVTDSTQANMVIDTSTSSACGGAANGVLGCFNAANAEITMIQGWNWYAGADPSQIGAAQYDFETTALHELGHALGLGGGSDPSSPMYEVLAAATTAHMVTVADLNIPDPPAGADPQSARPRPRLAVPTPAPASPAVNPGLTALDFALDELGKDLHPSGKDRAIQATRTSVVPAIDPAVRDTLLGQWLVVRLAPG